MSATAAAPLGQRSFDLAALSVAAAIALHAPHLPWWLTVPLLLVLGLRWRQRRDHHAHTPTWLKLPLLALLVLAVMGRYGNVFGQGPGTMLAIGLLVMKLLETETVRDARVGMGFACFTLMAALLSDQSLVATVAVALGLLPPLAALRSLEPGRRVPAALWRELLPGMALLAAALPLAALAFLLVPRLGSPLWGAPNSGELRSGLADNMTPAGFTQLLIDDSPALRVSFDGPPPAPGQRYFRAYVMGHYDGATWTYRDTADPPAAIEAARSIRYRISLEPTRQRVLPTLDVPLSAPPDASLRRDRVAMADKPVDELRDYALTSATAYRLEPRLGRNRARWLQLPAGFNPRTLALGQSWRQQHGGDDAAIVQAALAMFHDGGFRYTLAPAPLGSDAMDDFLFVTHEGFCEHYASAFTVLMRAAGIPARVVTGYQGGYWNAMGSYLLVRNSDAHAWSEVWLAGHGWVRVDPTAAVRPQRIDFGAAAAAPGGQLPWYQSGWLQSLRNRWDIVNRWWNLGVNGFDALRQRGLLKPFGVSNAETSTLAGLLAASCVLAMLVGLAWVWRRREPEDSARAALRRLERKLARMGVVRGNGEGPRDFLQRAARALPAQRDRLIELMHCYLELRYARNEATAEPLRALQRAVRNFPVSRVVK